MRQPGIRGCSCCVTRQVARRYAASAESYCPAFSAISAASRVSYGVSEHSFRASSRSSKLRLDCLPGQSGQRPPGSSFGGCSCFAGIERRGCGELGSRLGEFPLPRQQEPQRKPRFKALGVSLDRAAIKAGGLVQFGQGVGDIPGVEEGSRIARMIIQPWRQFGFGAFQSALTIRASASITCWDGGFTSAVEGGFACVSGREDWAQRGTMARAAARARTVRRTKNLNFQFKLDVACRGGEAPGFAAQEKDRMRAKIGISSVCTSRIGMRSHARLPPCPASQRPVRSNV